MTSNGCLRVSAMACALVLSGCVHNYQKDITVRLQKLYSTPSKGQPMNGYVFGALLLPVGTLFCNDFADKWPIPPNDECVFASSANYFVQTVSDQEKKKILEMIILSLKNGTFNLTDDVVTNVKADASVPLIGLAKIDANVDISKHVTVTLGGQQVMKRIIQWDPFLSQGENFTERMRAHLAKRDYVLAAADIVIVGFSANVNYTSGLKAGAKAELEKSLESLVAGSSGKLALDTSVNGTYKVTSVDPVVVAGLYVKPRLGGGSAAAKEDPTTWPRAAVPAAKGFFVVQ